MKSPKLIFGGFLSVLAAIIFLSTYFTVDPNEVAVVTRFGKIEYTAGPGLHFKAPFVNSVETFRTDITEVGPKKAVNTYTIDNQEVDVNFNVFYRIPADKAAYVYQNVRDYRDRLFVMAIDRLKAEMGKVNVTSVAEKRGELRDAVKTVLQRDAMGLGIEVTDFQLTDLQYDEGFRNAVKEAAKQKAGIETREYERQQAEKKADTDRIKALGEANAAREQAKGAADARLFAAQAEAKAIQLQGEAQAEAIKAQAEALKSNPNLVQLREVEKWNGVRVPENVFGNSPVPFMNVQPKNLH